MKVHIPNPCHANWQAMTPRDNGRHCTTCDQVVVDFTSMSTEQITQYFKERQYQRICGRYKHTQTDQPQPWLHKQLVSLQSAIEQRRSGYVRAACLLIIGMCMFITGCRYATIGEEKAAIAGSAGKQAQCEADTTALMGKVVAEPGDSGELMGEVEYRK